MVKVTISGNEYDSFSDVATADAYLAGDALRADSWASLQADPKSRALVSATRLLARLAWKDGVPDLDAAPQEVIDATAILAANIALKPALTDEAAPASNVKAAGAGSARVEFFSPTAAAILPKPVLDLLRPLLGSSDADDALEPVAFGADDGQCSRFPAALDDFPLPESGL